MAELTPALDVLKERSYIFEMDPSPGVGRPSRIFLVNPKLSEGWK